MVEQRSEDFQFKAEVRQLLDILVHSLYSNREIFLRELLSNASDAIDKLRFMQSSGEAIADDATQLEITIDVADSESSGRSITVRDTGIGMTHAEIVENLGTIAHSGTSKFVQAAAQGQAAGNLESLIGRFGVGFYSVFMVADMVELTTRSARSGEPAWRWRSDGLGSYTIEQVEDEAPRGTSITLHLKEDAARFAQPGTLKDVILRHSGFLSHPILLAGERVNTVAALWREPKFGITPERYQEFYTYLTHDDDAPLETLHLSVDAPVQFNALVFVPAHSDMAMYHGAEHPGLDLYARRVLIQHDAKDLLPEYLGFLRGVVDSEDLPLNISRETLQENLVLRKISQTLVGHLYDQLDKLAATDTYAAFWKEHGSQFKFGYNDYARRERFAKLLRFESSATEGEALTSLADCKARGKEGQKAIYFAAGPGGRAALEASPHLELFRRKGLEVIYCLEAVDEFALSALGEFDGLAIQSVEHVSPADIAELPDVVPAGQEVPEPLTETQQPAFEALLAHMAATLGTRVTAVRASQRLLDSPACLVDPEDTGAGGPRLTSGMRKVYQAMTARATPGAATELTPPPMVLEVNPNHPLTRNLLAIHQGRPDDAYLSLATEQLYEAALLQDGYLTDPQALIRHLQQLLTTSSGWYKERL